MRQRNVWTSSTRRSARQNGILATPASVVSHIRVDNRRDPLTRLASADENASSSHPLPQGGEGSQFNSPLASLGERDLGVRGARQGAVVKFYAGHHTSFGGIPAHRNGDMR